MYGKDENVNADEQVFIAGTLFLNTQTKKAKTYNSELVLTADEFDALLILAQREDIPVSFEELYGAVWDKGGTDRRDEARKGIANIMEQINADGFLLRIDLDPEIGYTFRMNWSHNRDKWMKQNAGLDPPDVKKNAVSSADAKRRRRKWQGAAISFAACAVIMVFVFVGLPLFNADAPGEDEYITFEEPQIPLAVWEEPEQNCETCEDCENCEICEDCQKHEDEQRGTP